MATTMRRRWSDDDYYFGPFTYARDSRGYRPFAVVLESGDDEDRVCQIRTSGFGHTLIAGLPQVLKPWRQWVDTSKYEWSKNPAGGYWDTHRRAYGFSLSEGFLQVFLGAQTGDSSTQQDWCKFLPWTQWRHVRHSFYGLQGEHVATLPDTGKRWPVDQGDRKRRWEHERAVEAAVPTIAFAFDDFDGERITATTKIEEREWRFGTGWFKWLSLFRKPRIKQYLDIDFSAETGERKGSWKGGTVGHSIEMLPGELHEAAFRRYCAENAMTFVGLAAE